MNYIILVLILILLILLFINRTSKKENFSQINFDYANKEDSP